MSQYKIKTPHAAVIVWNYKDRIGLPEDDQYDATGVDAPINEVNEIIISTLSCISIQTSKAKGKPDGEFSLVLAPYRNWVSSITAGSWCCILMSNDPITKESLRKANPNHVKMIGRIETVRCETSAGEEGERRTLYYVSGVDWGHIFNATLYIDNLIGAGEAKDLRNIAALAFQEALFGKDGTPLPQSVGKNLSNILAVMGKPVPVGIQEDGKLVGRLPKTVYEYELPDKMLEFLTFVDLKGKNINNKSINKMLNLQTGTLESPEKYHDYEESIGFVNPFSLQGTATMWQILQENSNSTLNEMFSDMNWTDKGLQLLIFNRIKPFALRRFTSKTPKSDPLLSYFQFLKTHDLDNNEVISVNAGTNWRDKFNFIEIKPDFQEFQVFENMYKQKAQAFDEQAFKREGFRPLILNTRQFPAGSVRENKKDEGISIDWDQLEKWVKMLRAWYFNTHLTLNGSISIHGSTEYIAVGTNIRFRAALLDSNANINSGIRANNRGWILAHVESISNSFSVGNNGERIYRTNINFVRGIVVDVNGNVIATDGGAIDQDATHLDGRKRNTININSTSDNNDPDKLKNNGT